MGATQGERGGLVIAQLALVDQVAGVGDLSTAEIIERCAERDLSRPLLSAECNTVWRSVIAKFLRRCVTESPTPCA